MVYDDVPADRHQWARLTLEAHLIKLVRDGRVASATESGSPAAHEGATGGIAARASSVRRGDKWVLRDITWRLRPGERWALLGDNGAGKTQLLKLLSGDIWPTPARVATGGLGASFGSGGAASICSTPKTRMAYIGGERQDKYARYGWNLRVRDLVATGLHRTDLLLAPVTARDAKRGGSRPCEPAACSASAAANSCPCPTEKSAWCCWRAHWCRIRIGCCWMSSTMAWT